MSKILIILNAILYNRGSEALARGLVDICKKADSDSVITLSSGELEFQETANYPNIDAYINRNSYTSRRSPVRYICAGLRTLHLYKWSTRLQTNKLLKLTRDMDLIIVIGADNYDFTYNMGNLMNTLNVALRGSSNAKMILLDCSFAREDLSPQIVENLHLFDAITVREPISHKYLLEKMNSNNIYYYPDPAFIISPEKVALPKAFLENNTVGINLSNLILSSTYSKERQTVLNSYCKLIEYILYETDMSVILIPHVMKGADLSALKVIYEKHQGTERLMLIEDETLNAAQLKYIISKCRLYIGARTHSTIAAYSSYVPTLVLGYSVKSVGIATDLFGESKNYVLPVAELKNDNQLLNHFKWIEKNQDSIKRHLQRIMPAYQERVWDTSKLIQEQLD